MPRWEPNPEERLRAAAIELFEERGYDGVTVDQIALSAGLSRRSFFRYFPDKREVLFLQSDDLGTAVAAALAVLPGADERNVVDTLFTTLGKIGEYLVTERAEQQRRRRVVAASPELLERERAKLSASATVIGESLEHHGLRHAHLLATIAIEMFRNAFEANLDDRNLDPVPFAEHLNRARNAVSRFLEFR